MRLFPNRPHIRTIQIMYINYLITYTKITMVVMAMVIILKVTAIIELTMMKYFTR